MKCNRVFRRPSGASAFTLVELLVVIGIIALLISILLPGMARARDQATKLKCLSNLRQIAMAAITYAGENKGFYPDSRTNNPYFVLNRSSFGFWDSRPMWAKYLKNADVFYCPSFDMALADLSSTSFRAIATNADDESPRTASKDPNVGWRRSPITIPATVVDIYVAINYNIFCGWSRPNGVDRILAYLDPTDPIPATDPAMTGKAYISNRYGAKNAADLPLATDATWNVQTVTLATAYASGPTFSVSHTKRGKFQGLNVVFQDGHAVWRTRKEAAPRLTYGNPTLPAASPIHNYLYWY